jgi:hypothetical protein
MHSSQELRSSSFEIQVDGRSARLEDLFEGFGEHDRLGVLVAHPCGAVGASALITATVTAFYDIQRARSDDFFVYPSYFLFHVGRPFGDHSMLDVWPARKEVVVPRDAEGILEAIVDRAITRLVVEDGRAGPVDFPPELLAAARSEIVSCLAYSPGGRVQPSDVRIASSPVTEGYVEAILAPDAHVGQLRAGDPASAYADTIAARAGEVEAEERASIGRARADLEENGRPVETYRRIGLDEALGLLAASGARAAAASGARAGAGAVPGARPQAG